MSDAWRRWSPAAQEKALSMLRSRTNDRWRPFYCDAKDCTKGSPHGKWTWNHARADQHPPTDTEWLTWMLLSGRGSGKTRAGAEWVHRMTRSTGRIAVVAGTGADARDTLIEGESGLMTIAPPDGLPTYEPSKRRLTWPNGAVATVFSAEEPDRLRGPEHGAAWCDENCFWPLVQQTWDNLLFGLRIGRRPRIVVTTTPKPRPWLRDLMADPRTRISRASTYDNLDNLAPTFAEQIIKRYEGTRLGRQEIYAEVLDDIEGALWSWEMIEGSRVAEPPDMARIVVGVDPAGTDKDRSDETGIVVVGIADGHYYVLADRSGRYSPVGWANAVMATYAEFSADAIVAETNYGGDMVLANLKAVDSRPRVIKVTARRAKALRAEPVVSKYEQNRVHHVGAHQELESQLTSFVPFARDVHDDRVDALVYATLELMRASEPAAMSSPTRLRLVRGA